MKSNCRYLFVEVKLTEIVLNKNKFIPSRAHSTTALYWPYDVDEKKKKNKYNFNYARNE